MNEKVTKRENDALVAKNTIYNSSLLLFGKYGYDNVTIADITKHAGFSKGNFYTHFESKISIFLELFNRIDNHYIAVFKKVNPNIKAEEKLRILIKEMCLYCKYTCGIEAMTIVYSNQITTHSDIRILNDDTRPYYNFLKEISEQGQKNGEFRDDLSLESMVEYIARSARGLLYDWCLYNNEFDLITEQEQFLEFILRALKK